MADTSRLVVIDKDRTLRDQLDRLAELRIYGTTASDVVRILTAQAYNRHFMTTAGPDKEEGKAGQ